MIAAFIDTEATGLFEPRPVELAYALCDDMSQPHWTITTKRYNPQKPIELGAMATHHILPFELEDQPPYTECKLPEGVEFIIGHKIDYDWEVLGKPEVKRICTLAIARTLLPALATHKLTALMYHFFAPAVARGYAQNAHGASADVEMLIKVFERLGAIAQIGAASWQQIWEFSERCRVPVRMSFGKYGPDLAAGKPIGELISEVRKDRGYLSWLLSGKCDQVNNDPYLRQALTQ